MRRILVIAFLCGALHSAFAENISLGTPTYAGTGCPSGSVGIALSPDGSTLSVLFDSYSVLANRTKRIDRKDCNLAVPVHIPTDISIAIVRMDYRGFSSVPAGAFADISVDSFFVGLMGHGPMHRHGIRPGIHTRFQFSNNISGSNVLWSPCGKDVNLRIASSVSAMTNFAGDQTTATLDSLDVAAGLVYQVQWRTCVAPKPQPIHPVPHPPPGPGPIRPPPR